MTNVFGYMSNQCIAGVKEKAQQFLGDNWKDLAISGTTITILKDVRFAQFLSETFCKALDK